MTDHSLPVDDEARTQALDVSRSFIVQAPAGSGKTELLTQRYLGLLALVDHPEEVWAITFTRKAAAEMRRRIFVALDDAMGPEPAAAHRKRTWALAKAVVKRDQARNWELGINPNRLQVFTIDSLCSKLVRQMPVLSGFGTVPSIANFPERLYIQAARRTLQSLHQGGEGSQYVQKLLSHLDNNAELAENLLANMLTARDRWLNHIAGKEGPERMRATLESALSDSVNMQLNKLEQGLPHDLVDELIDVVEYAAQQDLPADSAIRNCRKMDALPQADARHIPQWIGISEILLVATGGLRKKLTVKQGFPPADKSVSLQDKALRTEMKQRATEILTRLNEHPEFVRALAQVTDLPATKYSHEQWQVFLALQHLLKLAAAHLKLIFQELGEVDYTEVAHRALIALGDSENPTDLALHLDYRLKHLLVDEFQDTARSQFDLIAGLVAGWQTGDGRTLFLVGDPMQSIYRFREANVGLFLLARDHGINQVHPEFLQLECNFRSKPELVEWVNSTFVHAFPQHDNSNMGAVTFSSSAPAIAKNELQSVHLHRVPLPSAHIEADLVASLIRDHQQQNPDVTIAVLVRARSHLTEILPGLRAARIGYRAVDLENLREQPVVRDLFALTRALLHLGDRTAWLAVLRAPWCGLTLDDLFALAGNHEESTIWELIVNERRREPLSEDGQVRLSRLKGVLAKSLAERGRRSLRRWVEGTWLALGGPACVFSSNESRNADAYFKLLEQVEADGYDDDIDYLNEVINTLKAADDSAADASVQVMTIHKAKGLEFDVVIIPGMQKRPASSDTRLLRWMETSNLDGKQKLLLAPISATGDKDSIHRYLARLDAAMTRLEDVRLLYVAATRARDQLHLIGGLARSSKDDALLPPPKSSFLERIWSSVAESMCDPAQLYSEDTGVTLARPSLDPHSRPLYRVPSKWMMPDAPHPKPWRSAMLLAGEKDQVEFSWASETARHVGTVVHRVLQQVAIDGLKTWTEQWSDTLDDYLLQMLRMVGVPAAELNDAANRCEIAVRNSVMDERGRWILSAHEKASNELELSGWLDGQAQSVILDRTFIADGYRWIIDYKTGAHEGGTVDAFLDSEHERYQGQLSRYARLMLRMENTPIKLGLYFPMLQGWREWTYRN